MELTAKPVGIPAHKVSPGNQLVLPRRPWTGPPRTASMPSRTRGTPHAPDQGEAPSTGPRQPVAPSVPGSARPGTRTVASRESGFWPSRPARTAMDPVNPPGSPAPATNQVEYAAGHTCNIVTSGKVKV